MRDPLEGGRIKCMDGESMDIGGAEGILEGRINSQSGKCGKGGGEGRELIGQWASRD